MSASVWALLSALFAGLTALLAKLGVAGVHTDLAVAVRTAVVLVFAWGIVLARGETHGLAGMSGRTWLFLTLSGLATGLSWLCYFRALAAGQISRVAPIDKLSFVLAAALGILVLHEKWNWNLVAGLALIAAGVLLTLRS